MYDWLEVARIGLCLISLSFASWQDYKSREVSNTVWVFFAPLGLALTLSQILLTGQLHLLTGLAVSTLVLTCLSFALFYAGFFGGADAKALICLSMALPFRPVSVRPYLQPVSPLFSFSVFSNAVIISALTPVAIMIRNVTRFVRTRERLFEGLEHESSWKKFLALFTGYRVELSDLEERSHLAPLEELSEDGGVKRRLRLFTRIEDDASVKDVAGVSGRLEGKIWVTPYLPLMVFITIGLILALFLGDVVFWLVARLLQ